MPRVDASGAFVRTDHPVQAFGARLAQQRLGAANLSPDALNHPASINDWIARVEARMDLFNVFDAINFIARGPSDLTSTTGMGASLSNWEVTQAASDLSASQYPGGRMTSFGLRVSW